MDVLETKFEGVFILEPKVFRDDRGFFVESYNQKGFDEKVGKFTFVQDNHSKSSKGVLRGLQFQSPNGQGKLVRVLVGAVYDVVVDIRKKSPTFGEWFGIELTAENKKQLWIPPGFAHGFLSLEEDTEFFYKCTEFYSPEDEGTLLWNDQELSIKWPKLDVPYSLSDKDLEGMVLSRLVDL